MNVIVGLGNPGLRYRKTPHNVGFMAIEELARRGQTALRRSFRFPVRARRCSLGSHKVLLAQPLTYMNHSGAAVAAMLQKHGVLVSALIVLLDDADLPLGQIRVRARGSGGGHKGLLSIIRHTGNPDFIRIRMGIGRAADITSLVEYVLKPFPPDAEDQVAAMVRQAADAAECVLTDGPAAAMNKYNATPPAAGSCQNKN